MRRVDIASAPDRCLSNKTPGQALAFCVANSIGSQQPGSSAWVADPRALNLWL